MFAKAVLPTALELYCYKFVLATAVLPTYSIDSLLGFYPANFKEKNHCVHYFLFE